MKLKSFSQLPDPPKKQEPVVLSKKEAARKLTQIIRTVVPEPPRPLRKRELIAGGDIKWKPVDIAAARLLMKSPAIYHPPSMPSPNTTSPQPYPNIIDRERTSDEISTSIGAQVPRQKEKTEAHVVQLANNAAEAKALLEEIANTMRVDVMEFQDELPKAIKAIRSWRMTITQEKDLAITALQDLRKFFLAGDHEKEMARLENFIRTCERLRSLSQDGTLDKVAEVMLKLAQ